MDREVCVAGQYTESQLLSCVETATFHQYSISNISAAKVRVCSWVKRGSERMFVSKEGLRECTKFCRQVILVIAELHCTDMGIVQENENYLQQWKWLAVVKTIGVWKKGSSGFSCAPDTHETFRVCSHLAVACLSCFICEHSSQLLFSCRGLVLKTVTHSHFWNMFWQRWWRKQMFWKIHCVCR